MDTQQFRERRPAAARPQEGNPDLPGATAVLDAARDARDEARQRLDKVVQLLGKLKIEDARNSGGQ